MLALVDQLVDNLRVVGSGPLFLGFSPQDVPILVSDGLTTFAIGAVAPTGFDPVPGRPGISKLATRHSSVVANSIVRVDGHVYASILFDSNDPPNPVRLSVLAVHEMFHAYQAEALPLWGANEAELFTYPFTDVANEAGKQLEQLALEATAAEPERSAAWLRTFLDDRSGATCIARILCPR